MRSGIVLLAIGGPDGLFQRVAEGLSEDEAWRLFQQIVDALVYMSGVGVVSLINILLCFPLSPGPQIHRDIKLTNIFIGMNQPLL
jgi:eukaryotic translation initiation factor 2-alpha kinase 4